MKLMFSGWMSVASSLPTLKHNGWFHRSWLLVKRLHFATLTLSAYGGPDVTNCKKHHVVHKHLQHARIPSCEPGSIPGRVTGFSQVGIVPDYAVGRRVFSGISCFFRPFIPAPLHIISITIMGSEDFDNQLAPTTHSPQWVSAEPPCPYYSLVTVGMCRTGCLALLTTGAGSRGEDELVAAEASVVVCSDAQRVPGAWGKAAHDQLVGGGEARRRQPLPAAPGPWPVLQLPATERAAAVRPRLQIQHGRRRADARCATRSFHDRPDYREDRKPCGCVGPTSSVQLDTASGIKFQEGTIQHIDIKKYGLRLILTTAFRGGHDDCAGLARTYRTAGCEGHLVAGATLEITQSKHGVFWVYRDLMPFVSLPPVLEGVPCNTTCLLEVAELTQRAARACIKYTMPPTCATNQFNPPLKSSFSKKSRGVQLLLGGYKQCEANSCWFDQLLPFVVIDAGNTNFP
ncbi:hypothetical protein PR048_033102 [Dryococelus australis]|uniref:Uncharacterized protein n=1 Tax=Dryococelus australis TaxID=614101 RepID=A0ABQ9FZA0_9NEOP|nr:hypothetical protein PR048_033102 [Dryococelus australis]